MKHLLPTLLVLPLIACGGSDGPEPRSAASIDTENRFLAAAEEHEAAFDEKVLYAVPTTGSAEANGAFKAKFTYTDGREGRMVGDVKAEFDFANDTMSGEVSDIETRMFKTGDQAEQLTSGGLLTLDGTRDTSTTPAGHEFVGTLSGSVNMPNPDGSDDALATDLTLNTTGLILRDEVTTELPDGTFERTIIGARGSVDAEGNPIPLWLETFNGQWSGTTAAGE